MLKQVIESYIRENYSKYYPLQLFSKTSKYNKTQYDDSGTNSSTLLVGDMIDSC